MAMSMPLYGSAEKPATGRFRKRYRSLSLDEQQLQDDIKAKAEELEALFDKIKTGRYRSLAFTELELAVMWAVKEITS